MHPIYIYQIYLLGVGSSRVAPKGAPQGAEGPRGVRQGVRGQSNSSQTDILRVKIPAALPVFRGEFSPLR